MNPIDAILVGSRRDVAERYFADCRTDSHITNDPAFITTIRSSDHDHSDSPQLPWRVWRDLRGYAHGRWRMGNTEWLPTTAGSERSVRPPRRSVRPACENGLRAIRHTPNQVSSPRTREPRMPDSS